MKRLILVPFLFFMVLLSKSQTIENVDFKFVDDKILVYYDLIGCKNDNKYEIDIKFTDNKGNTITPRNLAGDAGLVTCGKNKKAIWDLSREVEKFEGKLRVIVTIANIFDSDGLLVVTGISDQNEFSIIKSKKIEDNIIVEMNWGGESNIKLNNIYFVTSENKFLNSLGERIRKIGMIKIIGTQSDSSTGNLTLNSNLKYDQIQNRLPSLSLLQYKTFRINLYAKTGWRGLDIKGSLEQYFGFGVGINCYPANNLLFFGIESGINKAKFELLLKIGITPYLVNSNHFFFGCEVIPIPTEVKNFTGNIYRSKTNYGFSYGLFLGSQFDRISFIFSADRGKYSATWRSIGQNYPFYRISLKAAYSFN